MSNVFSGGLCSDRRAYWTEEHSLAGMDIQEAYEHVSRSFPGDPGRFFEPGSRLDLGKGCIYRDAIFAAFNESTARFVTAQGTVYVLTHECDVDASNARLFNTDVLVRP